MDTEEDTPKLPSWFANLPASQRTPQKSPAVFHKYSTSPFAQKTAPDDASAGDKDLKKALLHLPKKAKMTQLDQNIREVYESIEPYWIGVGTSVLQMFILLHHNSLQKIITSNMKIVSVWKCKHVALLTLEKMASSVFLT
jgi:hypothetical protein